MKYYFQIQFRRLLRHIQDFGVNPIFGISLIGIVFSIISYMLFSQLPEYATYIYLFIAANTIFSISSLKNREFLKLSFSKREMIRLRLLENSIISLPFIIFMLVRSEFLGMLILLVLNIFLVNANLNTSIDISFKTPFSKYPFEFSRGFRKTFLVYLLAYILTAIGMSVENMNLGIFAILLLGLTCTHYYSLSEPDYYVWVYNNGAKKMIRGKLKRGILNFLISVSPIVIAMAVFFPEEIIFQLASVLLMLLLLMANLFLKYAHFPRNIELIQAILFPISLLFPPLLFVIIPFYYSKAIKQIQTLTQ